MHDAFEMMWCCSGSYASSFTPSTSVTSGSVAGALMMTFFAPALEVLRGVVALREEAGRLDHHLGAHVAPGERRGIALGEHLQLVAVHDQAVVGEVDLALERAEDRVVLEQVSERLRVGQVVDPDPVDVGALRVERRGRRSARCGRSR